MNQSYLQDQDTCPLIKVKSSTVSFLIAYSKSLDIITAKGLAFETNLN